MSFSNFIQKIIEYLQFIFINNFIAKFIIACCAVVFNVVFIETNPLMIKLIIVIYLIDLVSWVWLALYLKRLSSYWFFKWLFKLWIYWVLIIIWHSVDTALWTWTVVKSWIISFIIITDSISILENLDWLWFDVPVFFLKYLRAARIKVEKTFLENIHENMEDLMRAKDKNDKFTYVNKSICEKLLKIKEPMEAIWKKDIDFVSNEFWEICQNSDNITKKNYKEKNQRSSRFIEREIWKNQVELWLDVIKTVITDSKWNITWTIGSARIINEIMSSKEKQKFMQWNQIEIPLNYKYQ